MEAKTEKKNDMYYGVVENDGEIVHKTATPFYFPEFALKRARQWIEQLREEKKQKKIKSSRRVLNHYYKNKE